MITRVNKQEEISLSEKHLSLEEAKQEVLAMVNKGENYRSIAKIPFKVNGVVRRFNISTISDWKKEKDKTISAKNEGSMVSKAFQLFEDKKGPIQCVIELNIQP